MNNFKFIVLLATILGSSSLFAQTPIYDVKFATLDFDVTTVNGTVTSPMIINTNGTSLSAYSASSANNSGTRVLYRNIITIGGQPIDCIVTNVDGTNTFDEANSDTLLDEMLITTVAVSNTLPYKRLTFDFVITSFNNNSYSFLPVILNNVVLNIYDIDTDGAGQTKNRIRVFKDNVIEAEIVSGQMQVLNTDQNVWDIYQGSTSANNPTNSGYSKVVNDNHRVYFTFANMKTLVIELGCVNAGTNETPQFFLAFSPGANFTSVVVNNEIIVDLNGNGTSDGVNNEELVNTNNPYNFTLSGTNISKTSSTTLNGIEISYDLSDIQDQTNETMIINGANSSSLSIPLYFTTAPTSSTFALSSNTYTVSYSILNGRNTIRFTQLTNNVNSLDLTKAETLLDALQYKNALPSGNGIGTRNFIVIGTGTYTVTIGTTTTTYPVTSPPAIFIANIPTALPVNVISFTGKALENANQLNWTVAQEVDFSHYEVLRSEDGRAFNTVGTVFATENSMDMKSYSFVDASATSEVSYYKLKLVDNNGSVAYTSLVVVSRNAILPTVSNLFPNPATTQVNIEVQGVSVDNFNVSVQDINGKIVYQANQVSAMSNVYQMDVTNFNRGVYVIRIEDEMGNVSVSRFAVSK